MELKMIGLLAACFVPLASNRSRRDSRKCLRYSLEAGATWAGPGLCVLLACANIHGAEMSASVTAPVINGADIANYGTVTHTDKWWPENSTGAGSVKGQTFTTGPLKVLLKAITYQVTATQKAEPIKTYVIRVGSVFSNIFTELHTETATQTFTWNGGEYMTWELDTPVLLEAHSIYGIDIGITSSTSGWPTGIPYINYGGNEYPGGSRYTSGQFGVGTPQLNLDNNRDRIFHLDLDYLPHGFQLILE